jgi:hypothetical protein
MNSKLETFNESFKIKKPAPIKINKPLPPKQIFKKIASSKVVKNIAKSKAVKTIGKGIGKAAKALGVKKLLDGAIGLLTGQNNREIKKYKKEISDLKDKNKNQYAKYILSQTDLTSANYNMNKTTKQNSFYKDNLYGSGNKMGYIEIAAKKRAGLIDGYTNIEPFIEGAMNADKLSANYNNVVSENLLLEKQIQENANNYTADDSKTFYKTQQYSYQLLINTILTWVFYIVVVCLAIYLGFYDRTLSMYVKAGIIIILLAYPYFIEYLEFMVYFIAKLAYSFLYGVPFTINNYYGFEFVSDE